MKLTSTFVHFTCILLAIDAKWISRREPTNCEVLQAAIDDMGNYMRDNVPAEYMEFAKTQYGYMLTHNIFDAPQDVICEFAEVRNAEDFAKWTEQNIEDAREDYDDFSIYILDQFGDIETIAQYFPAYAKDLPYKIRNFAQAVMDVGIVKPRPQ